MSVCAMSVIGLSAVDAAHNNKELSVWLRTGRPGDRGSIPDRGKRIFRLAPVSRPALGPPSPLYNG
jgi:hypothetical protein